MRYPLFLFGVFLILFSVSCKKDKQEDSLSDVYYFTADFDGDPIEFTEGREGYFSGSGAKGSDLPGTAECQINQTASMFNLESVSASYMVLNVLETRSCEVPANCDEFKEYFTVGSRNFGKEYLNDSTDFSDGVVLNYIDGSGVQWRTDIGSRDQTGSSFEFTEFLNNDDGTAPNISRSNFTCTLYDGFGNSIKVTNGELRSRCVVCTVQ